MATLLSILGFEHGTATGLNLGITGVPSTRCFDRLVGSVGTNIEVVSAAARTGGYGLRLTSSAATVHAGWQNSGSGGTLGTAGVLVGSFWFRFPTLPSNDYNIFIDIGTAGGNDFILKFLNSTTGLQAVLGGSTQLGPQITANTWVHVEFRCVHNANPHTVDWNVDGVAQTQVSLAAASESIFVAGFGQDNANSTGVLHVDDVLMSVTSIDWPLGKHKVVGLLPDTGDTATEIGTANATGRMVTNSAIDATFNSANILAAISEVPPLTGGSASGLGQRTSGTGNACNIPMTTYSLAGGETITSSRIYACTWAASATSAANNLGLRAFNGTSETALFAAAAYQGVNTAAPTWFRYIYNGLTNQSTLDALAVRVGYSTDIAPLPGVHAVYAEVAVKEGVATASAPPLQPVRRMLPYLVR